METFLKQLLGETDLQTYAAAFILAAVGGLISLRLHAKNRDKHSPATPYKFSWKFLFQDNLQRLLTGFLLTFVAFRFCNELVGIEFTMWTAFLIGLLNDQVAGLISKLEFKAREQV